MDLIAFAVLGHLYQVLRTALDSHSICNIQDANRVSRCDNGTLMQLQCIDPSIAAQPAAVMDVYARRDCSIGHERAAAVNIHARVQGSADDQGPPIDGRAVAIVCVARYR